MELRHFLQPLGAQAGHLLIDALGPIDTHAEVVIVTAWLKASGMRRLQPYLQEVVEHGGHVLVIAGIDQLGTTREGLTIALTSGCDLWVYHDKPGTGAGVARSFHPKIYWVKRPNSALVLLGSGNMTAGGLFTNYEWFEHLLLDLERPEDKEVMRQLERSVDDLMAEPATIRRIDGPAGLTELLAVHGSAIPSEKKAAREKRHWPETRRSLFGGRLGLPLAPEVPTETDDPDLPTAERSRRQRRSASGKPPVILAGLRRVIQRIGKGRPGQIQLRKRVADWIFGDRSRITFERASDGTRRRRPVVATHARGHVNTMRVELEGFDQNAEPSLVVLEQMPDGSIEWQFYRLTDPAAQPFVRTLPTSAGRTMPATLQELDASGRWQAVATLA